MQRRVHAELPFVFPACFNLGSNVQGRQATQRDLYYSLSQQSDIFNCPRWVGILPPL